MRIEEVKGVHSPDPFLGLDHSRWIAAGLYINSRPTGGALNGGDHHFFFGAVKIYKEQPHHVNHFLLEFLHHLIRSNRVRLGPGDFLPEPSPLQA